MRDMFRLAYTARMSAEADTGEVLLYGEIVQEMPKYWKEQVPEDKSARDFDKAVKELRQGGAKKLLLRINSPGGAVYEAVAMRAILTGAGFEEIHIRIEGLCASAATILATVPEADVEIAPGSAYMIHNPWSFAFGNADEMLKEVEILRQIEQTSRSFYVQRTGQEEEQIKAWMDAETWFTAEDAVKYHFADRLSEERASQPAACASARCAAVMRGMYRHVPEEITGTGDVSNAAPVAGAAPEILCEEEIATMEIKDLTMEQLRAENPALLAEIEQCTLRADRERREEIDALTLPGYEAMAEKAKADGTSALDFQKAVVAAARKKGQTFLQQRAEETAPAQEVTGGAASDESGDEEAEISAFAAEMAAYARETRSAYDGMQ